MNGTLTIETGVAEATQASMFMNATLQSATEHRAISIAVELPAGLFVDGGTDPDDAEQTRILLSRVFASALEAGCSVQAMIGPSSDSPNPDDEEEE